MTTNTLSPKPNIVKQNAFFLVLLFTIILVGGIWLRFDSLGRASLWIDEAFVDWFTNKSWSEMFTALHLDAVFLPAQFVMVKIFTGVLGKTEFTLRLFSAFIGCVGIVMAILLGWLIGKWPGAIISGWFWAFHPMLVWYSQDAKPYALGSTLALTLIILFLTLQRRKSTLYSIMAILVIMVGLLSHHYFFLVTMALILYSMARMFIDPGFFTKWFGLTIAGSIPMVIWLVWYFSQTNPSIGIGWIAQPKLLDILETFWNLYSGYGGQVSLLTTMFGALAIFLTIIGIASGDDKNLAKYSLIFGLLVPITVVWLVSQRRPIYMDRYFIIILPFAIPPLSRGALRVWDTIIQKTDKTYLSMIAVTSIAVLIGLGMLTGRQVRIENKYAREDWRELTTYLLQKEAETPRVWFYDPESLIPFQYYANGRTLQLIKSNVPPTCLDSCWYVIRQPFTPTHAFAQGGDTQQQEWLPDLPQNCRLIDQWVSPSRLALWKVSCGIR